MRMRRLAVLGLFLAALMITSCSDDESVPRPVEYSLPPTQQATDLVRYCIEGGGNIDFTIADAQEAFAVHVTEYQFVDRDEHFAVEKSGVASSTTALLESLFDGTVDIGGTIYVPEGETGTWTTIYVQKEDDWLRIANETIIGELGAFQQLVREHLDADGGS